MKCKCNCKANAAMVTFRARSNYSCLSNFLLCLCLSLHFPRLPLCWQSYVPHVCQPDVSSRYHRWNPVFTLTAAACYHLTQVWLALSFSHPQCFSQLVICDSLSVCPPVRDAEINFISVLNLLPAYTPWPHLYRYFWFLWFQCVHVDKTLWMEKNNVITSVHTWL